jgi:hypothetical protein
MIERHVPRPRDLRQLWLGAWAFASALVGSHDPGAGAAGPGPLFEAVVRDLLGPLVERPSYAQIVAWTCQDHPGEVHAEL